MPQVVVERLDHLGVIAGVIKDLGLVELIDSRIEVDEKEEITTGEAITGMILNGLGFSDRPISLTPQFFQNKPLAVSFRPGVEADHFNRFKLGRSLDKVFGYGCDVLFSEISMDVCRQEAVDLRFHSLDTTTFSLTGAYVPDSDESAIRIVRGYSKDHRPDLKQVVLETIVSQNGGIPLVCKSWDGNASDTKIFEARAADLIAQFQGADAPRYLVADAKLYTKDNAPNLSRLSFITRLPETIKVVGHVIEQAWDFEAWDFIDASLAYQRVELSHYGISQRWLVVYSKQAEQRAKKTLHKAQKREQDTVQKSPLSSTGTNLTPNKKPKGPRCYRQKVEVSSHRKGAYKTPFRCQKRAFHTQNTHQRYRWQITADILPIKKKSSCETAQSTFVIGSNIPHQDIIQAYKGQKAVETGFRFLKDPLFFVSSLFLKKPSRIQALLSDDPGTVSILLPSAECVLIDTLPDTTAQRWLFDGIQSYTHRDIHMDLSQNQNPETVCQFLLLSFPITLFLYKILYYG